MECKELQPNVIVSELKLPQKTFARNSSRFTLIEINVKELHATSTPSKGFPQKMHRYSTVHVCCLLYQVPFSLVENSR